MEIYNIDNIKKLNIKYPDIYFTPEYGELCEISDKGKWKCIINKEYNILIPFIEKNMKENKIHLISNYGYGGFYIKSNNNLDVEEYYKLIKANNYNTHFIRFTPYFNNNKYIFKNINSNLFIKGKTFGVNLNINYELYLKSTKKNHKRSLKKYSDKCKFNIRNLNINDTKINSDFINIYNETMNRVNSSKYYYFNNKYFEKLFELLSNNVSIAEIIFDNIIIASAIILKWQNKYLHYHLGGSRTDYLYLYPNNKLHDGVIKYGIENKYQLYHLGGGVFSKDNLEKFKESFSNISFDYYQAKVVY